MTIVALKFISKVSAVLSISQMCYRWRFFPEEDKVFKKNYLSSVRKITLKKLVSLTVLLIFSDFDENLPMNLSPDF